jgi:hypothetical protein
MAWPYPRSPDDDDAGGRRCQPPIGAVVSPLSLDQAAALGDEVQAFVHGRLVDHLVAAGRLVPAWTVLNKLAHASEDELSELAATNNGEATGAPEAGEPAWLRAQRSLAAALTTGARRPDDIASLQQKVLVPLELWLIQRSRSEPITSRHVIELASEALADYPATE